MKSANFLTNTDQHSIFIDYNFSSVNTLRILILSLENNKWKKNIRTKYNQIVIFESGGAKDPQKTPLLVATMLEGFVGPKRPISFLIFSLFDGSPNALDVYSLPPLSAVHPTPLKIVPTARISDCRADDTTIVYIVPTSGF